MSDPSWLSDSHASAPVRPASKADQNAAPSWENDGGQSGIAGGAAAGTKGDDVPAFAKWIQFITNWGMGVFVVATGIMAIIFSTGTQIDAAPSSLFL